jgi:hypothetical protein
VAIKMDAEMFKQTPEEICIGKKCKLGLLTLKANNQLCLNLFFYKPFISDVL